MLNEFTENDLRDPRGDELTTKERRNKVYPGTCLKIHQVIGAAEVTRL